MNTYTFVDFYISPMTKNRKNLARLGKFFLKINLRFNNILFLELTATINVKPMLENDRIEGVLTEDILLQFTEVFSKIGNFHEA